jgi:hypothetical protein
MLWGSLLRNLRIQSTVPESCATVSTFDFLGGFGATSGIQPNRRRAIRFEAVNL